MLIELHFFLNFFKILRYFKLFRKKSHGKFLLKNYLCMDWHKNVQRVPLEIHTFLKKNSEAIVFLFSLS